MELFKIIKVKRDRGKRAKAGLECGRRMALNSFSTLQITVLNIKIAWLLDTQKILGNTKITKNAESQFNGNLIQDWGSNVENKLFI